MTETYLGKSEHETTGTVVPLEGEGDFQSQQREGTKQCRTWIYLGLTGVKSKGQKSGAVTPLLPKKSQWKFLSEIKAMPSKLLSK